MKKHLLKLLLLCCTGILALSLFACVPTTEQYKVDFIVDGQVYKSCTTSGNSRVTLPSDPTKTAYVFKGWYFDEGKWTKEFNAHSFEKDPIEKDVNIYARFELDKTHTCNKLWKIELQATCQSEGKRVQRCSYPECAKVYAVETVPIKVNSNGEVVHTGATDTVKIIGTPATCTTEGSCTEMYYCSLCKAKTGEETFEIPVDNNAHKFVNDDINHTNLVRADDVFNFSAQCEFCPFKVNLANVDVTEKIDEVATCTTPGSKYYTCSVYGIEFTSAKEEIPAKGHYINGVAIEDKVYSEKTHSKIFSKITLIDDPNRDETCCETAADGDRIMQGVYKCDVCHENDYISVFKPHKNGTWVKTANAECYKPGEEILASCSSCGGKNLTREIPATEAHVDGETILVKDGAKFHLAVACTKRSKGCTHIDIMVENVEVEEQTIISKDCTVDDVIRYTHVTASGKYSYDEPIDHGKGHFLNGVRAETLQDQAGWFDYRYIDNGINVFDNIYLTCDQETYGMYVCESCKQDILVTVYRPHSGTWVTTKAPTCTFEGIANFYCDIEGCTYGDDNTVTKVVEPLGHDYDYTLGIENDRFLLNGKCHCNETEVIKNVSVDVSITKEPTCKEAGTIVYTCYHSGGVYEMSEAIPVIPHALGNELIDEGARLEYVKYVKNGSVKLRFANISCTDSVDDTSNDMSASYICTECGDTVAVKVYRLHDGETTIIDTDSSPCVISGKKQFACSYYGCTYVSETDYNKDEHNYVATRTSNPDGTQTIFAKCNVEGCGDTKTYSGLTSVDVDIKTEATCSSMGYVEYTFFYGGETYTLGAVIDRGNHVLNGVDFETLMVNGKLPDDITEFVIVRDAYYFMCEECGMHVRVDVATN